MKRWWLAVALATTGIASLVFAQARTDAAKEPAKKAELGEQAPDFSLKDVYGKTFTLSEFKDKIVVLEWVNHECPISRGKHTDQTMQNTYAKYAEKGVIWLGIDSTHSNTADTVRVAAAKHHLTFPVLLDPDGKVGRTYAARTTPHMYVVDRKGKLVYNGAIDDRKEQERVNHVAAALEDLLADKPVATSRTDPYGCGVKYAK